MLEIRAAAGYRTAADVDQLFDALQREVHKLPSSERVVAAVDWRFCPLMSPEAAQRIGQRIAANNDRTERSAALADPNAALPVLQFLRVVREAEHPERRVFFDPIELIHYLSERLSALELTRLHSFLTEDPAKAAPSR